MPAIPVEKAMPVQTAVGNVVNVVRAYKGDASEHDILKQSLETIASTLNENREELEGLAAELEAANVQIRTLQAELASLSPEEAPAEEAPAPTATRPVKLEGTPRIGRPAQRAGA
jgi:peptidoglycan hydrolase CwlO-like protein